MWPKAPLRVQSIRCTWLQAVLQPLRPVVASDRHGKEQEGSPGRGDRLEGTGTGKGSPCGTGALGRCERQAGGGQAELSVQRGLASSRKRCSDQPPKLALQVF